MFSITRIAILALLFIPFGIPVFISNSFEEILGYVLADCDGMICFQVPTIRGWFLVLAIYLTFFGVFQLIRFLQHKRIIEKITGLILFISLVLIFGGSLLFLGDESNFSPLRCSVLSERVFNKKSYCFSYLAEGLQEGYAPDPFYCSKIGNDHIKNYCYTRVSFKKNNPDICYLIQDEKAKLRCLVYDPNFDFFTCHRQDSSDVMVPHDVCDLLVAKKERSGDLRVCRFIFNQQIKKDCFVQILAYDGDISSCDEFKNSILIDSCYESVTKARELIANCSEMQGSNNEKSLCYITAVERANNNY